VLKQSSLADAALRETADADLIAVASCGTYLLPGEVMEWLEHWAVRRQIRDVAVMAFCPEENARPMSLGKRLKEFAKWHGLPFLGCHILRDDGDSLDFVNRLRQQKQPPQHVVPALQSFAELSPPRHWGINE
jgi:hypothetical protein